MTVVFAESIETQASLLEAKAYVLDVGPYIEGQAGVSVSSATATLTDPSGNTASLVTAPDVVGDVVTFLVTAAEFDELGSWKLDVVVTLAGSAETPTARWEIEVVF